MVKCEKCGKALTAAEAKSGKYRYYVCHSLLKKGRGTCKTPRLNSKRFEKLMIEQIRANILTESNIRDLVRLMDEEMDGVAAEQRERLENIEAELIEVRRRLDRVWHVIENSELDISDATSRIREHRERQEKLEIAAEEARALLSERRAVLDNVDTIAAFAEDMSDFLMTSEITESRAFIKSFVKEIKVKPGKATVYYTIPISQSTTKTSVLVGSGPERWTADEKGCFFPVIATNSPNTTRLTPRGSPGPTLTPGWRPSACTGVHRLTQCTGLHQPPSAGRAQHRSIRASQSARAALPWRRPVRIGGHTLNLRSLLCSPQLVPRVSYYKLFN